MKKVKIATFLKERKIKLKPDEANNSNLKRIEKIDFDGDITIVPTNTKTDMILVKKGDLIISGINVEKGALSIYQGEEDVLASIHYSAYEFDETQIYILYLKYFLKSREFRRLLMEQSGSGIKNEIKAKHILPLEIQLPSIQEQHKIVERIQAVENDIVELNEKIIQQYDDCKNLRQSILQRAVEGKLCEQNPDDEPASVLLEKIKKEKERLVEEGKIKKQKDLPPISDEEKPFKLPNGWEWCRLADIGSITDGTHQTPIYTEKGVPFLSAQNIKPFKFMPSNIKTVSHDDYIKYTKVSKPEKGDILLTRVGAGIGEAALINNDMNFAIYVSLCLIKPFLRTLDMQYILVWLNGYYGRKASKENTLGKGTSQGNLNLNLICNFLIPIPPLQEQRRIVEKVDELMILCDKLEKEVNDAQKYASQLMEAVLQEAFANDEQVTEEQPKYKGKVIPIRPEQKAEFHFAMAARGNIKQSTLESLQKRAIEISNGEK